MDYDLEANEFKLSHTLAQMGDGGHSEYKLKCDITVCAASNQDSECNKMANSCWKDDDDTVVMYKCQACEDDDSYCVNQLAEDKSAAAVCQAADDSKDDDASDDDDSGDAKPANCSPVPGAVDNSMFKTDVTTYPDLFEHHIDIACGTWGPAFDEEERFGSQFIEGEGNLDELFKENGMDPDNAGHKNQNNCLYSTVVAALRDSFQ